MQEVQSFETYLEKEKLAFMGNCLIPIWTVCETISSFSRDLANYNNSISIYDLFKSHLYFLRVVKIILQINSSNISGDCFVSVCLEKASEMDQTTLNQ